NTSRRVVLDGGGLVTLSGQGRRRILYMDTYDGPHLGGGAVRALSQYHGLPVYVVASRFTGNVCSNGAALSSIGVSWTVLSSHLVGNRAIGTGANPARPGTPGGSGGVIYNDGDRMTLTVGGSLFMGNHANEGGGAIFFVSNDRSGMSIRD